jgi:tRNA U34 5-methylaminomethyl-2-thiouridine-forming methyltransferase MnmC
MKKHVKRISNEKSTQSLRDADERYHVKKNEIAQRLDQIEKLFRYSYENETYKID